MKRYLIIALCLLAVFVPTQTGLSTQKPLTSQHEKEVAVFAGGCFWGVDAVFRHVRGVLDVASGYAGGEASTANYTDVSTGTTGHAESVRIVFNPGVVSYRQLLDIFFRVAHDPTQLDRQGPDVGVQYRSAIFFMTPEQNAEARQFIRRLDSARVYRSPIVTNVVPLRKFYPAEAYHQDYLARHRQDPYIVINDLPKLEQLRKKYPEMYLP